MALVVNDRVKETSTTTGTGTFDLAGAISGFETFVAGIGSTNTTYYAIVNSNGEFEVGLGTVTDAATDTLSRDTIISSSNSDSAVNFSAGTKNVFCTLPASKAVILDSSGNIVANNGSNLTALNASNISSGTLSSDRLPTVPTTKGGTGLTSLGTANQVIAVNAGATALEYQTVDLANLNASNLTSGTVPDARFPATLPALNGSALTDLNATNLASGTVANARLDAQLQDVAGLAVTDGNFIVGDGSNFVAENGSTVRDSAGLGTANDVQFNSFGVGTAASATTGQIRATDDITAFYSSDASLKENVKNIENPLDKINQINGVTFDWTEDYIKQNGGEDDYFVRKNDVGVIAQEVEKVLPQVVATRSDGIKAVKYDRIVALLIESIKELKKEIEELKSGA